MELVIDRGNTHTKYAVFSQEKIIQSGLDSKGDLGFLEACFGEYQIEKLIISSVKPITKDLELLMAQCDYVLVLSHKSPLPISLEYDTPATLGRDRIAAVVGASFLFPSSNCLVLDAGTCITYDFIDHNGDYQGGSISPGLGMRYKALNKFTGALPLVKHEAPSNFVGKSTELSIRTGVFNGMVHEINGTIRKYKLEKSPLNLVICGGDAKNLLVAMEDKALHEENLVLIGLHKILIYNALQNN
jgi:type III pantothenate kinase